MRLDVCVVFSILDQKQPVIEDAPDSKGSVE